MTDARLPERWLNDRRLRRLPDDAFRLFVTSLMWSVANKTDGVLTEHDLALIPGGGNRGAVWILTDIGLWICRSLDPGSGQDHYWLIVDFEATQTTRAELEAAEAARRKARDKKRRQRAAASAVPRDVPRDTSRPGQARPGQAPRNVVPGNALTADDEKKSSDVAQQRRAAGGGLGLDRSINQSIDQRYGAAPSRSLRDRDGPDSRGPDVQHFSDEVHLQSQAADRNAREDRLACPVCGVRQRLRTNGKITRHGPLGTPCRGSGLAITGAAK